MPGKNLLYIIHPSLSHITASRKLLKFLSKRGFEITLCTNSQGKPLIKALPYQTIFVDSMPFASGFEEQMSLGLEKGQYYETLLLKKARHFYKHRKNAFEHILNRIKPNVILVDILYATDMVLLYNWSWEHNCTVLYVRTKVNPLFDLHTPPMNSAYSGSNKWINGVLWGVFSAKKSIKDGINFVKYQGFDDRSSLRKSLALVRDLKPHSRWYGCVGSQFQHLPELVLLPREFEMPHFIPRSNSKYIGFQYAQPDHTMELPKDLKQVVQNALSQHHKIIYISFGSLYERYRRKIKSLLQKLILALRSEDKISCILSLKDAQSLLQLPDNVHAFDFVNQFALLQYADLFITHGGINSIKEALIQNVPMLVYPLNRQWDQPGNSARIQRHGLGLKGSIRWDSAKNIREKVVQLLYDDSFVDNGRKFKKAEENYSEEVLYAALVETGAMKNATNESIPTWF